MKSDRAIIPITCKAIRPDICPYGPVPVTLSRIFLFGDMRIARLSLAIGALTWALLLILPSLAGQHLFPDPAHFVTGQGKLTYLVMAKIMPEQAWALMFAMHGLFLMVGVFYKVPPAANLLDAFNGAALWTTATASCFIAHFIGWPEHSTPAAMSMDFSAVLLSWWWFVRCLADPRHEADH